MKRILSLDLARGFTVLMIAPIHTVMLFLNTSDRNSLLAQGLAFIAEWHGAQIFMLIMGVSFTFSRHQSYKATIIKSGGLLLIAYMLNIFKFVIPHFFGWMPQSLLTELQIDSGIHGYIQLFAIGDILHFAAIATLLLPLVAKLSAKTQLLIIAAITIFSQLFWDIPGLSLLGGHPPQVFFPLFPWLIYPIIGLMIGNFLRAGQEQNQQWVNLDSLWIIGLFLLVIGTTLKYFSGINEISSFYRTYPIDTILHVAFVLMALSTWHWISLNTRNNYLFRLFTYCSRSITRIYIIQWILIFLLLPFIGYRQSGFAETILLIILTSVITLICSLMIDLIKSTKPSK